MKMESLYKSGFTYTLGRSLYVPLTCRCNSLTLVQTRGPDFELPTHIVSALVNVRQVEEGYITTGFDENVDRQRLGPLPLDRTTKISQEKRHPTISQLASEIDEQKQRSHYDQFVIAGEGEPTLRMETLLSLCQQHLHDDNVRLLTNGLVSTNVASKLVEAGVNTVSVSLMTSSAVQYKKLMEPLNGLDHDTVCHFINACVQQGLEVEATGVSRDFVNKPKAEELAASLGVILPFRWRPYFDY